MRKVYQGTAMALVLAFCGAASAATVPVNQLSGNFGATNPSVASTNDGVQFGVYANGASGFGSLFYVGANGLRLNQITALGFSERHNTTDNNPSAAPYLRIFLNDDADDVIFDATECATTVPPQNTSNHFDVVGNDVRYDDDSCDGVPPDQQPWADVVATHGSDVVGGIYITTGGNGGANLSALVTDLTVNGDTFCFNCPPLLAAGPPAPAAGTSSSAPTSAASTVAPKQTCKGDSVRKLHAPKRPGQRFLTTRATLRGKTLPVKGRTVTANLTGQPEANYNVRLTSRYRTHRGKVVTVKITRNLSVVCA